MYNDVRWKWLDFRLFVGFTKSMTSVLGSEFKTVADEYYKSAKNGFFVYAPKSKGKIRNIIKYLGRYLSRPPIATSRTDHYDGVNVTFHYKRHEDDSLVTETVTASEFIKRLVVHVPPRYFNMVRYYGLYAKSKIHLNKIGNILTAKRYSHCFRSLLMKTLGIDPHRCSVCGQNLIFAWLTHTPFNKISFYNSRPLLLTSWFLCVFSCLSLLAGENFILIRTPFLCYLLELIRKHFASLWNLIFPIMQETGIA